MNNKNIIDSIQKFNSECFDAILTHKPMVLADVLSQLAIELDNTDLDIGSRLKNIKLYSTIGLLLLEEDKMCLVSLSTGDQILRDNSFYRDLISLMNTSAFKTFRANHMTKDKFLGERPNTYEISAVCPGRIGAWVGWEIVRKYAEDNPDLSLEEVMDMENANQLFNDSNYKGRSSGFF